MDINEHYQHLLTIPSDIRTDMPVLHQYASECKSIIEFGTGFANSTAAMLAAQPEKLTSYDLRFLPSALYLEHLAGKTNFRLIQADVLKIDIEPVDLLFIDTLHTYVQLSQELRRHGNFARKYLIFHDTVIYGKVSEDGTRPGLLSAIRSFIKDNPHWKIKDHHIKHNGLTVLQRSER